MKKFHTLLIVGLSFMLVLTSFTLLESKEKANPNPVKISVIYNHPQDPEAFEEYYENVHRLKAEKMKGVSRLELTKFDSGAEGESPQFYRMAELYFPSIEAMEKVLATPEAQAALQDLDNFATGGVIVLVGTAEDFVFLEK